MPKKVNKKKSPEEIWEGIRDCGTRVLVGTASNSEKMINIFNPITCHHTLCTSGKCEKKRKEDIKKKYNRVLRETASNEGLKMITLTKMSIPILDSILNIPLRMHLNEFKKEIRKFSDSLLHVGSLSAIEININSRNEIYMHVHIVTGIPIVEVAYLSDLWKEISGSYIVHITKIRKVKRAVDYLFKGANEVCKVGRGMSLQRKWKTMNIDEQLHIIEELYRFRWVEPYSKLRKSCKITNMAFLDDEEAEIHFIENIEIPKDFGKCNVIFYRGKLIERMDKALDLQDFYSIDEEKIEELKTQWEKNYIIFARMQEIYLRNVDKNKSFVQRYVEFRDKSVKIKSIFALMYKKYVRQKYYLFKSVISELIKKDELYLYFLIERFTISKGKKIQKLMMEYM